MGIQRGRGQGRRSKQRNKFDLQDMSTNAFSADTDIDWGGITTIPDEEYAVEIAQGEVPTRKEPVSVNRHQSQKQPASTKQWTGWIAFILAIASLFIWPRTLGMGAVIIGFIAFRQGNRTVGIWSMVIGMLAILAAIAIVPFFA